MQSTDEADLTGRVALVMGVSGAGRAIALALADAGADVAVTTTTPDAEEAFALRRLTKAITDRGRRSMAESVDMSIGTNVQIAVRQIAKEMGRIDLLVAAPDFVLSRPAERLSDADWSKLVGLNLSAAFHACRAAGREMLNREPQPGETARGRIIVLAPAIDPATDGTAAYRAVRAAVLALVEALNDEWSPRGVNVHAIVLPTETDEAAERGVTALVMQIATGAGKG